MKILFTRILVKNNCKFCLQLLTFNKRTKIMIIIVILTCLQTNINNEL